MKILCLTPWFPCHREEQQGNFILDSVESLADYGHDITVLVSEAWRPSCARWFDKKWQKKSASIFSISDKVSMHVSRHFSIPRHYFHSLSIAAYKNALSANLQFLAQKYGCELIHAHTEISAVAAIDAAAKLNIPSLVTLHGIDTDKKLYTGKTRQVLFENMLRKVDRVVLVGESLKPFFKKFVAHDDHFRIVHNGFRSHAVIEKTSFAEGLRFISVSNLHAGKGIEINLLALAKLNEKGFKNWIYKIVGDGPERKKLEKLARELNLQAQVFFLGQCDHNQVFHHLSSADIFTLPSYREAFGVAYIEAMAMGLLTIGVKGQGPEAFIQHLKNGLLVPPQDAETLAALFSQLFLQQKELMALATAGKNYVHAHFTWAQHAQNLTKIYQEILVSTK